MAESSVTSSVSLPELRDILAAGLQFGHATSRWNPKMRQYIYGSKNDIHIIDVVKTRQMLGEALAFLEEAASRGPVVFVGTKRQAVDLVRESAINAGAFFVTDRWAGGLLTNFDTVKTSLKRLHNLEKGFAEGVEGRTKFEVAQMKVEWQRLNRLYGGIKSIEQMPVAVVVIDPRYEKVAVREARKVHVPVVALADTNCDPDMVDYLIPGNDDAIGAIRLVMELAAKAVLAGNKGNGVKHDLTDYTSLEVKLLKTAETADEIEEVKAAMPAEEKTATVTVKSTAPAKKGILERAKEEASGKKVTTETTAKRVKSKK